MQTYYNQISNQKRIAFIDNLTDSQAQNLSNKYQFAVCFANVPETIEGVEKNYPVIWHGGKRYGFTNIDKTTIQIFDVNVGLRIDPDLGQLQLYYTTPVDGLDVENVYNLYNDNSKNIINLDSSNIYTIETIYNTALINFSFFKYVINDIGEETKETQSNVSYEIDFSYNSTYIESISKYNSEFPNSYKLIVKKSTSGSIPITAKISVGGIDKTITFKCKLVKIPASCTWTNSQNNTITSIDLYKNVEYTTSQFKLSLDANVPTNTKFTTVITSNVNGWGDEDDIPLTQSNLGNIGKIIVDKLQGIDTLGNNTSITLSVKITEQVSETITKINTLSNKLTVKFVSGDKSLFRVCNQTILNSINNNEIIDNTQLSGIQVIPNSSNVINSSTTIENTWYEFRTYNFNSSNISVDTNTRIIMPAGYRLALPIYNTNTLTNPIDDPMWTVDTSKNITINGKSYKVYKYNTSYYNSSNQLSSPKLLSIIVQE